MTRNDAEPFVIVIRSVVPVPIRSVTLLATIFVVAGVPLCSIEKSPLSVCPATISWTPVPKMRTNGPAGRLSEIVREPTVTLSSTFAFVRLIARPKVPSSVTPGTSDEKSTWPLTCPAIPPGATSSTPSPWSRICVAPNDTVRFAIASRSRF